MKLVKFSFKKPTSRVSPWTIKDLAKRGLLSGGGNCPSFCQ